MVSAVNIIGENDDFDTVTGIEKVETVAVTKEARRVVEVVVGVGGDGMGEGVEGERRIVKKRSGDDNVRGGFERWGVRRRRESWVGVLE